MIHKIADNLKLIAINTPMCNMASFGDISLYDHKATIKYPYVNIDVVNSSNRGGAKTYTLRVYVCDRNEPYVAYNKCESILDSFMHDTEIQMENYTTNFFTLDFQDSVNGVWSDVQLSYAQENDCYNIPAVGDQYILMENGDLIRLDITV